MYYQVKQQNVGVYEGTTCTYILKRILYGVPFPFHTGFDHMAGMPNLVPHLTGPSLLATNVDFSK